MDGFVGLNGVYIGLTGLFLICLLACDNLGGNTVVISAREFRFDPSFIEWPSMGSVHVVLRNEGRERHVFQSPSLFAQGKFDDSHDHVLSMKKARAVILEPGKTVEFSLQLPPGLYPFRCWIKGHTGMEGTIRVSSKPH